jgi:putative transposase
LYIEGEPQSSKNKLNHRKESEGEIMIRAKKIYFSASTSEIDRLFACNRESSLVWNKCLQLSKQHYLDHGKWISKSELQKATKRQFHLHSQSIQAVCHKYLFARDSAYRAIQKGIKSACYPYRNKTHYNTKWAKDGFQIYENGKIELKMGIHNKKREKPITVYTKNLPEGKIKEIELCYDRGSIYRSLLKMENRINSMKKSNPLE